jgi:hypothetical protein
MATGDHELGKAAAGAGTAGTYTGEAGFLAYHEGVDFQHDISNYSLIFDIYLCCDE